VISLASQRQSMGFGCVSNNVLPNNLGYNAMPILNAARDATLPKHYPNTTQTCSRKQPPANGSSCTPHKQLLND
jgi:hypothetical protein